MAEQTEDRKHKATPQRRKRAREQGQFAQSRDLSSALMLLLGVGLLWLSGPMLLSALKANLTESLTIQGFAETDLLRGDGDALVGHISGKMLRCLGVLLPLLLGICGVAILNNWFQSGFYLFPGKLGLDVSRINPLQGFSRIFDGPNAAKVAFGLVKLVLIVIIALNGVRSTWTKVLSSVSLTTTAVAGLSWQLVLGFGLQIAVAMVLVGLAEYGFQWWRHERSLMMTDDELREEMKSSTGDPQLAAKRKKIRQEMLR